MKAHTVSQFYLRHFTDRDPNSPGFGQLWVRSAQDPKWAPQSPEDTACLEDYYAFDNEVSKPNEGIEGALGEIEGKAGEVFKKLNARAPDPANVEEVSNGPELSQRARISLAAFVVSTGLRVPRFHDRWQPLMPDIIKQEMADLHLQFVQNPEALADELRQYEEETGRTDLRGLTPSDFRLESLPEVTRPLLIQILLTKLFVPLMMALLNQTEWIFHLAQGNDVFITSDNPGSGVIKLRGPRPEIVFPLTRKIALYANPYPERARTARWRPASNRQVAEINLQTVALATRWFAPATVFPPTALSTHVMLPMAPK